MAQTCVLPCGGRKVEIKCGSAEIIKDLGNQVEIVVSGKTLLIDCTYEEFKALYEPSVNQSGMVVAQQARTIPGGITGDGSNGKSLPVTIKHRS